MKLKTLLNSSSDVEILELTDDSRIKTKNGLYFARKGFLSDGHNYIDQAIENGAVAIVHTDPVNEIEGIEYVQVNDVIETLHSVSNIFYNVPSKRLRVHGVTGTNGKSTTTKTMYDIMKRMGLKPGYIGTVSIEYADVFIPAKLSTPDILQLQYLLNDMTLKGVTDVFIEVSSQGLDLRRVEGLTFYDASFTNLSPEHLDYHLSMEAYFLAKAKFFEMDNKNTISIINRDDPYGLRLVEKNLPHTLTYGLGQEADYKATNIILNQDNTEFTLVYKNKKYQVESSFTVLFNVYNMLNVIAVLNQTGIEIETIIPYLKDAEEIEGRLERIDEGQDFSVYVDFAHTPDSFELLFKYLNSIKKPNARLISVFGADGDRDALKRPLMAKAATQHCDWTFITAADNRNEDMMKVINEVEKGVVSNNYEIIPDRLEAIAKAINFAKKDDIVIVLGKGHELTFYKDGVIEDYIGDHIWTRDVLKRRQNENK